MTTIDHATLSELLLSDNVSLELTAAWSDIAHDIPELGALAMSPLEGARHKDNVAHTIAVTAKTPQRLRVRLLALFHDVGKPPTRAQEGSKVTFYHHEAVGGRITDKVLTRLGFDSEITSQVAKLVAISGATKGADGWTDAAVRRLVEDAGDLLEDLLDFANVDVTSRHESQHELVRAETALLRQRIAQVRAEAIANAWRPVISGDDIMRRYDLKPSREIGRLLNLVVTAQRAAEATAAAFSAHDAWALLDNDAQREYDTSSDLRALLSAAAKSGRVTMRRSRM
jgi:poly(A) polymerase